MKLSINGEPKEVRDGLSVSELLKAEKVKMPEMVSVEVNEEILDREAFPTRILQDGEQVEFLYFMGGGA